MESGHQDGLVSGSYHVAAIPYPGRGHINPMMNLCWLLASKGLLVTVVVTEEWLGFLTSGAQLLPPSLRLRSIPNVLPSERTRGNDFSGFIHAVHYKMEAPVEALLQGLQPRADSILADSVLPWAAELAWRSNIPVVSLWTQSAMTFLALCSYGKHNADEQSPVDFSDGGNEHLSYLPRSSTRHFAGLLSNTSSLKIPRAIIEAISWFPKAQSLLFTSFYELESKAIDTLRFQIPIPIHSLGPCIPYMLCDTTDANATSSYFNWLDSQPVSSVLYVSLGSFLPITGPQMNEMAKGLHESGVRFLWVIRGAPESMKESDKGRSRGLMVPWCDQLRVLCHPSIGGFLTHCGWNSTLEGVFAGVPMLTFPLFWDQYPNSKRIVDDWKVGLRMKDVDEEEWVVGQGEVSRLVKKFMDLDAEESKGLRRRAAELKDKCMKALEEGGSSCTNLDAFVQEMVSKKRNISA